jgi:NADPH-dependent 2,4-dienoyl-CoA reductase/sulfur reductase-like enzyme/rhodanese-related sulfurtransferase
MSKSKLVIVGGVAAGASAAAKARRCSEEAEIIMFEKGRDISYATCGLPYYLSGVIKNRRRLLVTQAEFFRKRFNVDVRTNQEVVKIDRAAKKITVIDHAVGSEYQERYDRLVLATGSDPVIPPIPGIDKNFVFTMKTLDDTDRIYDFINVSQPRAAVIIGGGLIGMEMAENFAHLGIEVAVVEFMPQILTFLDREMAEIVTFHAQQKGVDFYLSEKVVRLDLDEESGQGYVETDQGRKLAADVVITSVGIRPNTRLAKEAGLEIGTTGGVLVDTAMRTSDPHIWAAGDCVESVNLVTNRPAIVPMGSAANKQGRAAGANTMGRNITVKGFTGTVIVKVFDYAVGKTGLSEQEALAAGYRPLITYVVADHHAGYYPGAKDIWIKTVVDQESGRLLGAQAIGEEGVDKRIDVMATAIYNRMAAEDLIHLDLAYAPPYSSARDPIIVAGAQHQNYAAGDWQPISPAALHEKIGAGDDFVLVDLRTKREIQQIGIIAGAVHIPIDELRDRLAELDRNAEIVLYCAVGLRSYLGNRILAMHGYENVLTMTGGIASWTYELIK